MPPRESREPYEDEDTDSPKGISDELIAHDVETKQDIRGEDIHQETRRVSSPRSSKHQTSLFDQLSLTEKTLEDVPKQKERLPTMERIKISEVWRRQVNERKIKIGKMGELAVIEHERSRLQQDQGNPNQNIRHVSLINDAAGYDIQSWNGDKEIYIEVKTTVGDFWSNLYFTQNEFDKMVELGEQYYLYRISNFKLDTGKGNLFIYAGKDLIMDSFEFNSKMYLLSEKSH